MVEIKVDQHQKGNSKMALSQNVKFPIFIWCICILNIWYHLCQNKTGIWSSRFWYNNKRWLLQRCHDRKKNYGNWIFLASHSPFFFSPQINFFSESHLTQCFPSTSLIGSYKKSLSPSRQNTTVPFLLL